MTHALNLCPTIEARPVFINLPCPIGYPMDADADAGACWIERHRWPERGRRGACLNCGQTLRDVRVRINPKTGEPIRKASRVAREIAAMQADVPPVVFVHSSPARGAAASTRGKSR